MALMLRRNLRPRLQPVASVAPVTPSRGQQPLPRREIAGFPVVSTPVDINTFSENLRREIENSIFGGNRE